MLCPADPITLDDRLRADPQVAPALKAVDHLLCHFPDWNHERPDLEGIAGEVVADVLATRCPRNFGGYVFEATQNACWRYLNGIREWSRPDLSWVEPRRYWSESEYELRSAELTEELLACCDDDLDRDIVAMRPTKNLAEIGAALSLDKSSVSRRLSAIKRRFDERDE